MAQGQFTKQEADATIEAVEEIYSSMSLTKKGEFLGHYNDIMLFLEAAKKNAPGEELQKLKCPACTSTHVRLNAIHIPPREGEYLYTCDNCTNQFNGGEADAGKTVSA